MKTDEKKLSEEYQVKKIMETELEVVYKNGKTGFLPITGRIPKECTGDCVVSAPF